MDTSGCVTEKQGTHKTGALHYTTLHYTTHHTTPHHTTLHYTTLQYTTLNYTTPRHTTLHYTTPRHTTPLHYTTLHYTTLITYLVTVTTKLNYNKSFKDKDIEWYKSASLSTLRNLLISNIGMSVTSKQTKKHILCVKSTSTTELLISK